LRSHPLYQLSVSRLRQFLREPGALFWSFGFPLLMTLTLGIAFRSRTPDPVRVAVVDGPDAAAARATLAADPGVRVELLPAAAARAALRTGRVDLVVVPGATARYELDPTRAESRTARLVVDDDLERAAGRQDRIAATVREVREPGARYIDFLVPGLLGMGLLSAGLWGVGYQIVEDRKGKLLKRMVATPMRRSHFLLAFVVLRLIFVTLELPVLLLFATLVFGVHIQGSIALLAGLAFLGALAFGGVGVLVASRAQNTATVSGVINLVMMPMYIGSGVFFSTERFPAAVQPVLKALPLTAMNDALRAVMNDGAGLAAVLPQAAYLATLGVGCFLLGVRIFRWT
jgi:ABC-2 type transport system permease protein